MGLWPPCTCHRHKNTWISSVGVRDLRAEILIAKVHKLAIEQQIATYEVKGNTNTWYRESQLHMAYGGTIGIVAICVVVLMCLVCYCNHKVKKNASGVVINQVTMDETPARKILFLLWAEALDTGSPDPRSSERR